MKKNISEMAWNEPRQDKNSEEDRGKEPRREGVPPDLDEIFGKIGKVFGSSGNKVSQGSSKIIFGIMALLFLLWILSGIYVVDAGQRGIELFLGKHSNTKEPGLTWRFPSPIGAYKIVDVERVHSLKISGLSRDAGALMLTKDEAIALVNIEVQYRIDSEQPEKYWFVSLTPDESVRDVVESATRERVGQTILDNILTTERQQLTDDVKVLAQSVLDKYGNGIIITKVNLEDAQPPEPVQMAFNEAIKARENQQRRINVADKEARIIIAEVEGEAIREITEAEGYREAKIAAASGEARRFEQLVVEYQKAPEVTRERLYLETMEEILAHTNKIVMPAEKSNNLMVLPIEQLLKAGKDGEASQNRSSNIESFSKRLEFIKGNEATPQQQPSQPIEKSNNMFPKTNIGY